MFDYIGISDEQIDKLEGEEIRDLLSAGLILTNGLRKGIVSQDEFNQQIHNIILAAFCIV